MSTARPTPAEERWHVLADRYPTLRRLARDVPEAGTWTYATLLSRCLFFVLGLCAAGLSYGVTRVFGVPLGALVTGVVLIGVAESLIRGRRMFASGIEEALWAAGAMLIGFQLFELFLRSADATALLWLAILAALAGWRLLNPLLTTCAALLASGALGAYSGGLFTAHLWLTALACFVVGGFALAAGAHRFERPSHDRMLDWLVVTMPLAGYSWLLLDRNAPLTLEALRAAELAALRPLLLVAGFGTAALLSGLRRRTHAPLLAALLCVALLAYELRALTGLALQWRLMLWGGLGLVLAVALERALRRARTGLTSRDVEGSNASLELAQLGGTVLTTSQAGAASASAAAAPRVEGQGGSFGGGGASGRF